MGQIRINSTSFSRDVIFDAGQKVRDVLAQAIEAEQGVFDEKEFALRYELLDDNGTRITDQLDRDANFMEGRTFMIQERGIVMGQLY